MKTNNPFSKLGEWFALNFNKLAQTFVGDGRTANIYFVTVKGNTITMTYDFATAHDHWKRVSANIDVECTLEDRLTGVLASVEPQTDEPGAELVRYEVDPLWAPPDYPPK